MNTTSVLAERNTLLKHLTVVLERQKGAGIVLRRAKVNRLKQLLERLILEDFVGAVERTRQIGNQAGRKVKHERGGDSGGPG